jgi:hypothetical protein
MSDRSKVIATIENVINTDYITIEIRHQSGKYVIECRVWHRTKDGMVQTDLFGGFTATATMVAPRFNAKKLEALAATAMSLPHVRADYEKLIAKPDFAKLGFPPFDRVKIAA